MPINTGFMPVAGGQRIGQNQKSNEPKKTFTVAWDKTAATVSQIVGIRGIANNIVINNPSQISVAILFNDHPYQTADKVSVSSEGKIRAEWKVVPYQHGNFTSGNYDVEIRYHGGLSGKTAFPLRIVQAGGNLYASTFQR